MDFLETFFENHEKSADFVVKHKQGVKLIGAVVGFMYGLAVLALKCSVFAFCFFFVGSFFF